MKKHPEFYETREQQDPSGLGQRGGQEVLSGDSIVGTEGREEKRAKEEKGKMTKEKERQRTSTRGQGDTGVLQEWWKGEDKSMENFGGGGEARVVQGVGLGAGSQVPAWRERHEGARGPEGDHSSHRRSRASLPWHRQEHAQQFPGQASAP